MRSDALLAFVPLGAPLSLVAGAGIATRSLIIDLLGNGVGQAPSNIIGNVTKFGEDPGIGGLRPELNVSVGTAAASSNSATLTAALQYAADLGSGGNYQPDTWHTVAEQPALAVGDLTANAIILRVPWLPAAPANLRPRFVSLLFSPLAATNFTALTIASALVTLVRDDQANRFAARNYSVS